MEFFNNIWVALSTPNESLLKMLYIPFTIIENFLIFLLFVSILKIHYSKKQVFVYLLTMSIIVLINILFIPSPINTFVNYFIMILLIYVILKQSILKSILLTVISTLLFALISTLITNPYLSIFNISTNEISSIPIYRIIYLAIIYIFIGAIILLLKYRNIKINLLDYIDNKNKSLIIFNLLLGLFTLSVQLVITIYYTDTLPTVITFLSFISLLTYFSISLFSLNRVVKLSQTSQKLATSEEYNNTLRILHDNVRGFKHDFDNIVTTIGGYIRTNDMEGLKQYYLQLEDDCQRVNNLYILNPEVVNNDGIYNLIMKKYHEAEEKNIKVNISFLLDLSTLNMKIYEFARILGILLDNAIEASSECEEKVINLTFRNDSKNSRQLIIVENTYNNKDVDTHKIFEKGVSGKENHTGLGLWEVNKLLNKNKNITLFTTKNEKYFTQQLEIYNN